MAGDCGDVVDSLCPTALADALNLAAGACLNTVLVSLGCEQVDSFDAVTPEDMVLIMLDRMAAAKQGAFPHTYIVGGDPASYTATARVGNP